MAAGAIPAEVFHPHPPLLSLPNRAQTVPKPSPQRPQVSLYSTRNLHPKSPDLDKHHTAIRNALSPRIHSPPPPQECPSNLATSKVTIARKRKRQAHISREMPSSPTLGILLTYNPSTPPFFLPSGSHVHFEEGARASAEPPLRASPDLLPRPAGGSAPSASPVPPRRSKQGNANWNSPPSTRYSLPPSLQTPLTWEMRHSSATSPSPSASQRHCPHCGGFSRERSRGRSEALWEL